MDKKEREGGHSLADTVTRVLKIAGFRKNNTDAANSPTSTERDHSICIASKYSVEQLSSTEHCEECNAQLVPGESDYNFHGATIIVTAAKVPVQRCTGGCGTLYPPEVALDLVERTIPLLRKAGETEQARELTKTKKALQKVVRESPTLVAVADVGQQ